MCATIATVRRWPFAASRRHSSCCAAAAVRSRARECADDRLLSGIQGRIDGEERGIRMPTPTFDQVIDLARQLPHGQRGQLIARLALELASDAPPARPPMTPDEARAALAEIRRAVAALAQARLTAGEQ